MSLIKKGTKLYSILKMKCPNCHEGHLFKNSNPYNLSEISDMPERCEHCHFKYEIETGFFYGAMYVSYALTIILVVFFLLLIYVLNINDFVLSLLVFGGILVLVFPIVFRLSRSIWLNMFVAYKSRK
ncbi:MAG: DUF983 domain-containing protein [Bacteroidetes bacterium]|nr:DUF983 domain-containing protein [Bacteroidota bacterium]MBV6460354.1 hypothetical protein [Flavobacteriales bacterium]WKZ74722.1 MAG: DUF983 domain-containing protein [Vicingaceae bacterium]MCL4815778.1 DUF983 domain-containing protein [Flavobacteriales bacterium]NOG95776.1 DUF983 domain-containing protein [Bacteroidota bacterium]